jgi:hypothetical protein
MAEPATATTTIAGLQPAALVAHVAVPGAGELSFAGPQPALLFAHATATPSPAPLAITGSSPTALVAETRSPTTGALLLTGTAPTLYIGIPLVKSRLETRRLRRSPHISDEQRRHFYSRFQLDLEAGVGQTEEGATLDPNEEPMVYLAVSDDGGHTFKEPVAKSAGKIGDYERRMTWNRLGSSRDRVFEVSMSAPVKWVLIDALIDVS